MAAGSAAAPPPRCCPHAAACSSLCPQVLNVACSTPVLPASRSAIDLYYVTVVLDSEAAAIAAKQLVVSLRNALVEQ